MPNNVVSYINCDISILEIIRKPLGFVAKYHSDVEETWIEAKMSISDQQYKWGLIELKRHKKKQLGRT